MNKVYEKITLSLIEIREARMTRKQLGDEASELLGTKSNPGGIVSGKGYNFPRARKEFRRAERRGANPVSDKDMENMSATGVAQSLGGRRRPGRVKSGLRGLRSRAIAQRGMRGGTQDIEGMKQQMKKNPDAFAPPIKLTADPRNPYHDKETMVSGRTRQTIHRLTKKKPMNMLTIPSQKHAGSAERHSKWVQSGGRDKVRAALAKQGKHLRGQDPRL
tara:strand:- start:2887 stop:3540 length:654 start_codon:yes stop_codon:yes gene_type:complete